MIDDLDTEARALLEALSQPRRRRVPRLAEALQGVEPVEVATPAGSVAAWRVGPGPAVLLVHGWEDDNALWGPLIERLLDVGRAVLVLDLPGHGYSAAEPTTVETCAAAVRTVAEALGPVDAVVAHSFGCPVIVRAMAQGLHAERAVLIAAAVPRRSRRWERLRDRGVPEAVVARAAELAPEAYDVEADVPAMTAQTLIVHALDDDECPVEHAEALAALWPGARLALADNLGHRLIAQDAATLERVVSFLA